MKYDVISTKLDDWTPTSQGFRTRARRSDITELIAESDSVSSL